MPLFAPIEKSDKSALLAHLRHSITNARDVFHGLDVDQLRSRPVPSSEATLGWLLLHMGEVVLEWGRRAAAAPEDPYAGMSAVEQMVAGGATTTIEDGESAEDIRARFDSYTEEGMRSFEAAELGTEVPVPDAPWYPEGQAPFDVRWVFFHVLEELHRHSGHADILREAVDGKQMYELRAEAEDIDMSYIETWFAAHASELGG